MARGRLRLAALSLVLGVALAAGPGRSVRAGMVVQDIIDAPGATSTRVMGINSAGQVVGTYSTSGGQQHAFLWSAGTFSSVDVAGASMTFVRGVNAAGATVGQTYDASSGKFTGYLRAADGTVTYLTDPGADRLAPNAINDSGTVVGQYYMTGFADRLPFQYSGGTVTLLPAATDTAFSTVPQAISAGGAVAGYYDESAGSHGFVEYASSYETIDVPLSPSTRLSGVDDLGNVVGQFQDVFGQYHGFWRTPSGVFNLIDIAGASQTTVFGLNSSGLVAGYFTDATGTHGFIGTPTAEAIPDDFFIKPTVVPEPSTLLCGGLALALTLATTRRRRVVNPSR